MRRNAFCKGVINDLGSVVVNVMDSHEGVAARTFIPFARCIWTETKLKAVFELFFPVVFSWLELLVSVLNNKKCPLVRKIPAFTF